MSTVLENSTEDEQLLEKVLRLQEKKKRRDELEKRNLTRGSKAGTYEVVSDGGWDPNRIYTDLTLGERLPLPKKSRLGDLLELPEGCWMPPDHVARQLSEEEVAKADAEGRLTLQALARIRRLQAPVPKAESDLRRVRSELSNSREVEKSIHERVESLEIEEKEKEAAVERAGKPLEEFFASRPPEWRELALKEAARDRDALPVEPPEKARAHFPPRLDGGKEFTINKVTGERERVR